MRKILGLFILSCMVTSCARMGTPTGGLKDITPPKFLGSKPDTLATGVDTKIKEIVLDFDEYVVVKDISKQVIISPPPRVTPSIEPASTARKFVAVKFYEPLEENTTYTINFGSSIQDNNEGNKLKDFSYTFSTGDKIDSLQVLGKIKQSLKKEIPASTVVSLYKITKDSLGKDTLDLKSKPYYVSRVDSAGNFRLKHLHEGNYRLIAFNDLNSNLIIDTDKEIAAFSTEIVNPETPKEYELTLSPVREKYKIVETAQEGQGVIKIKFKGNPEEVAVTSLEKDFPDIHVKHQPFADSLYVYFNSKELKEVTKRARIKFLAQHKEKTDTVNVLYDVDKETELSLTPKGKEVTPSGYFTVVSSNYLTRIDSSKIEVYKNKESVAFKAEIDTLNSKEVAVRFPMAFDSEYQVLIQPDAVQDFLGNKNADSLSYTIKTKKPSDYGNLTLKVQNKPASKFFFQLLTEKYEEVESIYGENELFEFKNLKPGKYLIRILVDENNNGFWDPADLDNFTPAEPSYIYTKPIDVRAYWNLTEVWIL